MSSMLSSFGNLFGRKKPPPPGAAPAQGGAGGSQAAGQGSDSRPSSDPAAAAAAAASVPSSGPSSPTAATTVASTPSLASATGSGASSPLSAQESAVASTRARPTSTSSSARPTSPPSAASSSASHSRQTSELIPPSPSHLVAAAVLNPSPSPPPAIAPRQYSLADLHHSRAPQPLPLPTSQRTVSTPVESSAVVTSSPHLSGQATPVSGTRTVSVQRRAISDPISNMLSAMGLNLPENLNCHRLGVGGRRNDSSEDDDSDIEEVRYQEEEEREELERELQLRMGSDVGIHKAVAADGSALAPHRPLAGSAPLGMTHLVPPAGASAISQTPTSTVARMLRKAGYTGVDAMLKGAGHTMPASMRTAMERSLIQHKNDEQLKMTANRNVATSGPTPLHRSQSLQPGSSSTTPSSPMHLPVPNNSRSPLSSLFSPSAASSSPSPSEGHLPSSAASASQLAALSTLPPPAILRGEDLLGQLPVGRSVSLSAASAPVSARRAEGEPEGDSLSPRSTLDTATAASIAAEDGHWSTEYSTKRTRKVSKKPSFAAPDPFSVSSPSHLGSSSAALPSELGLSSEWKRIDNEITPDLSAVATGLSKLEGLASKSTPTSAALTPAASPTPLATSPSAPDMPSSAPASWSVPDVCAFLLALGLQEHLARFERSLIDGELLLGLSEDDLRELGVIDRFHRRKIVKKLATLGASMAGGETNDTFETSGPLPRSHSATTAPIAASAAASAGYRPKHGPSRSLAPSSSVTSSARRHPRSNSAFLRRHNNDPTVDIGLEVDFQSLHPLSTQRGQSHSSFVGHSTSTSSGDEEEAFCAHMVVEEQSEVSELEADDGALYVSQAEVANVLRAIMPRQLQPAARHRLENDGSSSSSSSSSSSRSRPPKKSRETSLSQAPAPSSLDPYHDFVVDDSRQQSQSMVNDLAAPSLAPPAAPLSAAPLSSALSPSPVAAALDSASSSSPSHHLSIIDLKEIVSLRHLNEGAAGVAYLGRYRDQDVVVKQPKKLKIGSEEWLELQLHMSVPAHPNLVPFVGICMVRVQMYLVTRFIERGSLKSLLSVSSEQGGDALRAYYAHPLQLVRAACEIASGLAHMHASHFVHRDVAARNVLVAADGTHIVSDLGLSRRMETSANNDAHDPADSSRPEDVYTMHSLTALPARWTSPEALRSQQFTALSDVYSLGVLMFELLSGGALPYARVKDNLQVIAGVVMGDLELDWPPNSPPAIVAFIRRAMQPVDTRPTMAAFKNEMEVWLRNEIDKQQQARIRHDELGIEMAQM